MNRAARMCVIDCMTPDPDIFWRITIPLTDFTVWEGMLDPTLAKLILASAISAWMTACAWVIERIEIRQRNWRDR